MENCTDLEPASDDFEYFFQVYSDFPPASSFSFLSCSRSNAQVVMRFIPNWSLLTARKHTKWPEAKAASPILCGNADCVRTSLRSALQTARAILRHPIGKRESSAKFDPSKTQSYHAENAQFGPLLKIECRGLEFIGFDPSVIDRISE